MRHILSVGAAACALAASPVLAEPAAGTAASTLTGKQQCSDGRCSLQVTPAAMLAEAERLIHNKRYADATPFVAALAQVPGMELQYRFLSGFLAVETGDLKGAEKQFRAILNDNPGQTRVRLELARTLLMQGEEAGADYHFRLAQNDKNLPEEIARTIRNTRSILRDMRVWHFSFNFGFAPDSNINSATDAEQIDVHFGPLTLPLTLDEEARSQSGVGQTAEFAGGVRLRAAKNMALLFDAQGRVVNHDGTASDDILGQIAIGPEFRVGESTSLSVQALGQQRWYGGDLATREVGARLGLQKVLSEGQRVGVQLDARQIDSKFNEFYDGWRVGGVATYEHLIGNSFIASASLFGSRDWLDFDGFSNSSYGVNLGVGGELPLGINAGVSGGVARAMFDEPLAIYSTDKREDWRLNSRAYVGMRQFRLLGFSPSVEYNFTKVDSNYDLYTIDRHRVNFKLARYF